ncbi:hypothetical protein KAFR_0G01060 [Kazachstania africana CBS 2517]|uniref:Uncharacterized protein n=1 Tax=Kazachstania africana (strain ATCC 22294 / BCRC 22015 / CBS 2517 / CECT 1963 / NBRC 1671 / NRRL Y-8276) TaxID=1071382 RepID=H2AXN9_KAZAF|nr:hypothetical protein KAFR_0G01060 [Kazachstania africana CBS 2517]CCF59139.1 hypothetical protein KAFR_0G01060 [Kazachstania africana CBS 2517]
MNSNEELVVEAPTQLTLDANLQFKRQASEVSQKKLVINRERCIDPTLIDSFLSALRHGSDDVIRQKINNYVKDSTTLPSRIDKCNEFVKDELYPNWKLRKEVINFCELQATKMQKELETHSDRRNTTLVDARIDPYAERDLREQEEMKYMEINKIRNWVKNNVEIENILHYNSDRILKTTCDQNEEYLNKFFKSCK